MLSLPPAARLLSRFSIAFTAPTFQRWMVLFVGLVLCSGRRTLTRTLWTARSIAPGHFSDYHRVFCRARWSLWPLGKVLAAMVLELVPAGEPVVCPVDDTAIAHRGKRVYGKGRHRDGCRSAHRHMVWIWGHRWVVLAVNVKFPFASRPWALPVLAALYRTAEVNQQQGRRHKTPIRLAEQLMAALMHGFPQRRFILLGDGGYASHGLARFCYRHRSRLTLVSLLHPQAHLCQEPEPRPGYRGRRRIRGPKLPCPQQVVAATAKGQRATVGWYGGKPRRVELIEGVGHWYKATEGLVPIRWVFVHDLDGTHRDCYLYSTDPNLTASAIVTLYTGRWSIEVTFQEARQHLGLASTRNRKEQSVLRSVPCLLGSFSVICLLFHQHHQRRGILPRPQCYPWQTRRIISFSDAIADVRRMLWKPVLLESLGKQGLKELPPRFWLMLENQLVTAA